MCQSQKRFKAKKESYDRSYGRVDLIVQRKEKLLDCCQVQPWLPGKITGRPPHYATRFKAK